MKNKLLLLGILLSAVLLFFSCKTSNKENFKVLGALAPQKDMYYHCLSECERSDPAKQMTPTKGSWMCKQYCDSSMTDMTRRSGPSYVKDALVNTVDIVTNMDKTFNKCGQGTKGDWCRVQEFTSYEIDEKCRQDCAYSTLQPETCMKVCTDVKNVNKVSGGWSWK